MNKFRVKLAYDLLKELIIKQQEFRLVMWNYNNWNLDLPKDTMKKFPDQLVLDIKDSTLNQSFIENDEVILNTSFEGNEYIKVIRPEEVVGIIELNGNPMLINNFKMLPTKKIARKGKIDPEEVLKVIKPEVDESKHNYIINSLVKFQQNNKELFN